MTSPGFDDDYGDVDPASVDAQSGPLTGSRSKSAAAGTSRTGRRSPGVRKLQQLQQKLSGEMFQAGAMIGMGLNVTGYYICQESDQFTKAAVSLASHRPEWIEALEHLADLGPGITVGKTVLGIGAALAVDRGKADPEKKFMQFLGVHSAWKAVTSGASGPEEGNAYRPPPAGAFVPVT